jgi:xanthine dehydrogenase accessory factor
MLVIRLTLAVKPGKLLIALIYSIKIPIVKEIKDIVSAYDEAQKEGKQTALATVVHLQGSAYRRPGARMLVTEDGKLTGAISGGCLEGDALRKAQLAMVQKKPMLVTYDTTDDDDTTLGVGLGCNGIISILIEPVNAEDDRNPVQLLKTFLSKRQAAVIATLFSLDKKATQPGTCLLLTKEAITKGNAAGDDHLRALENDAWQALKAEASSIKAFNNHEQLTGFFEYLEVPVSLLIFGAGNDSMPLVQMANILGWETTVVDGRSNYATKERFPAATKLLISKPVEAMPKIYIDQRTVAALMTHNYNYDIAVLRLLMHTAINYVGVLGPKKKLDRMMEELDEAGESIGERQLSLIHGPAGLDIGSETSEEIALSIMAEMKAVLSKRKGTFLRDKNEPIHHEENLLIKQSL